MSHPCATELLLQIQAGWQVIALETFEEDRALEQLAAVARTCRRELVTWSSASGLAGSERGVGSLDDGLRAISTSSEPTVFVMLDAQAGLRDAGALRRLRDLIPVLRERMQCVVLVGPVLELPLELQREAGRAELPLPRLLELDALFDRELEDPDPEMRDAAVRAALGLTAAEAVRVLRKACTRAGGLNEDAITAMVREKRQALRRTPALSFHEIDTGLAEVGGVGELKRWLRERRRAFSAEARQFGLPVPKGLLLLGVQGCGKSLCAKSVAREWRFPLLRLDLAAAFGADGQSPESTMREAIRVAESLAPAVLWIDEIEKGFAASSDDARSSRVFGSFLTWLAEKETPVFVVATANDIGNLPPELLRRGRFDDLFFVDLPTLAERVEILTIHLRRRGRDPLHYPVEALAEQAERLSGAEIEQVVSAALYTAFSQSRELTENDLANAINETVPLYDTYEERIKELRDWARGRARAATVDAKIVDLFSTAERAGPVEPEAGPVEPEAGLVEPEAGLVEPEAGLVEPETS